MVRLALTALALALILFLLGLGLRKVWLGARKTLERTVELGPISSGLVPRLAWAALLVLVASGGIVRAMLP